MAITRHCSIYLDGKTISSHFGEILSLNDEW